MTWWYENEEDMSLEIMDYDKEKGWHYRPVKEKKMPFMKWVKTPDGYKPVEITVEEMKAQNAVKKAEREKAERISEQLEIVNDKNFDRIKDSIPVPKVESVNCKDCDDTVCCERGKDKLAYCPRCFEKKEKKMEFDRSRCYSALNADELKPGDKVIVADSLFTLRDKVINRTGWEKLDHIAEDCNGARFVVDDTMYFLAYLMERKENCTNCGEGKWDAEHQKILCDPVNCGNGNVVFRNHEIEVCEYWKPKTEPHYRPFKDTDELIKVWEQKWSEKTNGQKWHDCKLNMPLIWVRYKNLPESKGMLIDGFEDAIVYVMCADRSMQELFDKFEFLDGSPCGVEE